MEPLKVEPKPGDDVNVNFKGKWKPAKIVDYGRKWAHVKFQDRKRNSKVPISQIAALPKRPEPPKQAAWKAPAKEPEVAAHSRYGDPAGLHMDHFDMFYRIRDGGKPMAVITTYYKEEAMVMFDAVKKFRELLTKPAETTPESVPVPTPMVDSGKAPPEEPQPPAPKPAPPAAPKVVATDPAQPEVIKKKRGRPSKKETVF